MTTKKKTKKKGQWGGPRKNAGGARKGAGRPSEGPKKAVTVRLPLALYARLGKEPTARATELLTEALEKIHLCQNETISQR